MNEETYETGVEISQELQATIEKKVKELKAANPQLRVVFPIVVDGNEYDEKEVYVGYFQQPSFKALKRLYITEKSSHNK